MYAPLLPLVSSAPCAVRPITLPPQFSAPLRSTLLQVTQTLSSFYYTVDQQRGGCDSADCGDRTAIGTAITLGE